MDRTTRVPEVVDHLLELLQVRPPSELQLIDGPVLGELLANVLVVGMARDQDGQGYETRLERMEGYGRPRYEEQWTISCLISLSTGESRPGTVKALRAQVGAIFADVDSKLRDEQVVEGVWQRVALGAETTWLPVRHAQGTGMHVFFDVVGESLL